MSALVTTEKQRSHCRTIEALDPPVGSIDCQRTGPCVAVGGLGLP